VHLVGWGVSKVSNPSDLVRIIRGTATLPKNPV
jgi:hypothetical protein